MKKTVKLILVVVVITILSLMATSAYAYEIGDTVKWETVSWDDEVYDAEYVYAGEFKEGMNIVERSDVDRVYKFEAKESGYYFISECGGITFEEKTENGKPSGFAETQYMIDDEGDIGDIVYLEKGTHFALLYLEYGTTIKIEYYGTIENTTFDENREFILNEDAYLLGSGTETIDVYDYILTVEFSNGRSLVNHYDCTVEFDLVNEFKSGENEVIYKLPGGYEAKTTVTVYEITDIIESVELSNIGRYTTVYRDYNGDYFCCDNMAGETLTVKFTDGTEYAAMVNGYGEAEVLLPCGRVLYACLGHNYNEFYITIAEEYFMTVDCEVAGLMLGENLAILHDNNMEAFRSSMFYLKDAFSVMGNPEFMNVYLRWSAEEFVQVFRNIISFATYYLTIAR